VGRTMRGWALWLMVAGLLVAASGCRRAEPPLRHGVVNPAALVSLHPAWMRVRDLDQKIRALSAPAAAGPAAFFRLPTPARLERVELDLGRIDASQRLRMGDVIRERVKRDFEARSAQLRRQAQRNERSAG